MKNCFFLLFMLIFCNRLSAQRYCDLEVIGGVIGTTINIDPAGVTPTYFDLYFRNNGADTLKETDTVYFFSDFLTGGGRVYISPVILDPGGEINIKDTFYFASGPADGSSYELCDSVWFTSMISEPGIDTAIANNRKCRTLEVVHIKPSSLHEVATEDGKGAMLGIIPNPASGTIAFDFVAKNNSEVQATIYDMSGRLVLQQNYGPAYKGQSDYRLDVSTLQSGIYYIAIKQEGVRVRGKLLKQ